MFLGGREQLSSSKYCEGDHEYSWSEREQETIKSEQEKNIYTVYIRLKTWGGSSAK